jgi:signal transduction histidine kinase
VVIAPLISGGRVHGTIFLATRVKREFQPQEVELLTTIGQQIAGAIQNARLLEAEERRAEQFRVISRVGSQITSILDVDELLSELARLIHDSFPYYLVEIGLVDGDELVFRSGAGGTWEKDFESFHLDLSKTTVTTWVANHGEPVLIPDVSTEPRYTRVTDVESRSELALPLKVKNQIIGVLNVESDRLNGFDQSDLSVLSSLASQAAIAIDNARLVEEEKRRADQFQVISQVGSQITAILDVDELLDEISYSIKSTFGYYLVTIGLIEGDQLVFRAGLKSQWDQPNFIPPALELEGQGITAWVASHGEPLLVNDIRADTRFKYLETTSETRSELAVPLKTKSGVIGVLNVESDRPDAFDESDLILLQTLAQQAAIAIENAELYEQARELAVIEERNRLARDLHDSVSQTLFSSSLIAEVLPKLWQRDPEEGTRRLEELRLLSRGALAEMRTLLLELRPAALVEADIEDLLQQLAESAQARGQVPVSLTVDGHAEMPEAVKIAVYHISQEALNNIIKHAGAHEIELLLQLERDQVELSVTDDGTGFVPGQRSPEQLGLTIMQERAESVGGSLDVTSNPGQGTTIRFLWTEGNG